MNLSQIWDFYSFSLLDLRLVLFQFLGGPFKAWDFTCYDAFILFISWTALLYFSIYTDEMEMMFLLVFSAGKVGIWKCFS